jgi:hypothetical protein
MNRFAVVLVLLIGFSGSLVSENPAPVGSAQPQGKEGLHAGFAEADITPAVGKKDVYLAGFGQNRKATKVHDPLLARAVVLADGKRKVAIVSVDLVGLFREEVLAIRKELPGIDYVLVTSTHNHEGPDTLGLWGPGPFTSGIDPAYMTQVREQVVKAVKAADAASRPVSARLGAAKGPELLHDGREPYIKHDELVALQFDDAGTGKPAGVVVQWNCHPETLGSKNTEISADYVAWTVKHLAERYRCPVVYLTGTVGGLMTSLNVEVRDEKGNKLADGTFEKTERYGRLVGALAEKALGNSKPVTLTPFRVRSRELYLPLDNRLYVAGWQLGVLQRPAFAWQDDLYAAKPVDAKVSPKTRLCIQTEVAWLRLGELDVAAIPAEIYPELVLGKVQDPPDPGADFPDAPVEPGIYQQLRGPHRLIVGLANDEIGYVLPKRQWDEKAPFCYGRKKAQYGEVNSLGPETGPLLCRAFAELVKGEK